VYFALCGQPPFGEGDPAAIVARQLSGSVDVSQFSPPIAEWLERGLARNPEERYHDAAAMKEAWRAAVKSARRRERAQWWRRTSTRT